MNTKQDTRAKLLAINKDFSDAEFEVEGHKVLIRKPTIRERDEMRLKSIVSDDGEEPRFDNTAFQIWGIIHCCNDPETKKPMFEATDFNNLLTFPTGSWVDKIGEQVMKVLYVEVEEVKKD